MGPSCAPFVGGLSAVEHQQPKENAEVRVGL